MDIRNLTTTPLTTIVQCLNEAFAGYFVQLPEDVPYWENRFKAARVDYSLSFGMFEGDRLLGFIIHGIDEAGGLKTAFNTGTGVLQPARGYKVIDQLYAHALPLLRAAGVKRCTLEVIDQNERAIHVYERIGFRIARRLRCFKGALPQRTGAALAEEIPLSDIEQDLRATDAGYAWDNSLQAIKAAGDRYRCYGVAQRNGSRSGYFVLNRPTGWCCAWKATAAKACNRCWKRCRLRRRLSVSIT